MPLHDYRCPVCGACFEELVRSAEVEVACPECAAAPAERRLSAFLAGPSLGRDRSWTPAATRRDTGGHGHPH